MQRASARACCRICATAGPLWHALLACQCLAAASVPAAASCLQGLVRGRCLGQLQRGDEALASWVTGLMFLPIYSHLIHLPPGVGE